MCRLHCRLDHCQYCQSGEVYLVPELQAKRLQHTSCIILSAIEMTVDATLNTPTERVEHGRDRQR